MDPGTRVTLIQRLAATLAESEYTDVDLTLRTFGFPTAEQAPSGRYAYAVDMLSQGGDDDLAALQRYLHPVDIAAPHRAREDDASLPWRPEFFRLFMSHTHVHRVFVGGMRSTLERWGIQAFVAHDSIQPTTAWQVTIQAALQTCDALCALLTDDFRSSPWCDQEAGFALARSLVIVPLKVDRDPHGFLGTYQALNVRLGDHPSVAADAVLHALAHNSLTTDAMAPAIVKAFMASGSFNMTRERFPLLRRVRKEQWTQPRIDHVRRALRENTQLAHANLDGGQAVPDAVEELWREVLADAYVPF